MKKIISSISVLCMAILLAFGALNANEIDTSMEKSSSSNTNFAFYNQDNVIEIATNTISQLDNIEELEDVNQTRIYALLENNENGDKSFCELEPEKVEIKDFSNEEIVYESTYGVEVYEVDEQVDNVDSNLVDMGSFEMLPCDTKSRTKADDSGSYRANITITYTVSYVGTTTYVQLTKVSGGWEKLANGIGGSDRTVRYGSYNQSKTQYPSGNTFSYNTGFSRNKFSSSMSYGCTTSIKLRRGLDTNYWTLVLGCNIGENDL